MKFAGRLLVRNTGGNVTAESDTLVIDGVTYKLSLLPSGIVRPGKQSVIGNGVVIDPWALADEIDKEVVSQEDLAKFESDNPLLMYAAQIKALFEGPGE